MKRYDLNGTWSLYTEQKKIGKGTIPGSVYSVMLDNHSMENPHYRNNELQSLELMKEDYYFTREFYFEESKSEEILLCCEGLDTICDVWINNKFLFHAENMHRTYEYNIVSFLKQNCENTITIKFYSPTKWIKEKLEEDFIDGDIHAMKGFPHLRKAHCMFGWDWGPRLPDAGIWRDIYLLELDSSRIEEIHLRQFHENGKVFILPLVKQSKNADIQILMETPDGTITELAVNEKTEVEKAELWWPNGYGEQPLYKISVSLLEHGITVDAKEKKIGFRTLTVLRKKDEQGESFAQCINGIPYFAMGADYIPEDNLLSRVNEKRTRKLLMQCVQANFNTVRVWGGGYYPDDFFFSICDELGLVVWQDFMFSCADYHLTETFENEIRREFEDNIKRIRHHACLGLWCGNNEMEMFQDQDAYEGDRNARKKDYLCMFEYIIPQILKELDPDTFYWPASPSSGGSFEKPNDGSYGDVHYWDVWHGNKPFVEYRKYLFRYCSEFGFQSFPSMKTIETFTVEEDRNIFSRVMEMHQRNEGANGKIMNYLSQTFLYPSDLSTLTYASQLLQAEAIRYGVEHWRRNRGICMGAVYWQLNDIWPVASWSSIDYYGRLKALHYYAKRFFALVMISAEEIGETTNRISVVSEPSEIEKKVRLNVTNETKNKVKGTVKITLRDNYGKALRETETEIEINAFSAKWLDEEDFGEADMETNYVSYCFLSEGTVVSEGSVLFTAPKHFKFCNPNLRYEIKENKITVFSSAYAKSVEIDSETEDFVLNDNYFDLNGGSKTVEILEGIPQNIKLRSIYNIR